MIWLAAGLLVTARWIRSDEVEILLTSLALFTKQAPSGTAPHLQDVKRLKMLWHEEASQD